MRGASCWSATQACRVAMASFTRSPNPICGAIESQQRQVLPTSMSKRVLSDTCISCDGVSGLSMV